VRAIRHTTCRYVGYQNMWCVRQNMFYVCVLVDCIYTCRIAVRNCSCMSEIVLVRQNTRFRQCARMSARARDVQVYRLSGFLSRLSEYVPHEYSKKKCVSHCCVCVRRLYVCRQHSAAHLQRTATHLQHSAAHLQHSAAHLQHNATHCNALQRTCNTLLHTCNTLQHTCNTLNTPAAHLQHIAAIISASQHATCRYVSCQNMFCIRQNMFFFRQNMFFFRQNMFFLRQNTSFCFVRICSFYVRICSVYVYVNIYIRLENI